MGTKHNLGFTRQISVWLEITEANIKQPSAAQLQNVKWITLQRVKSLMKYTAGRKMRGLAQAGTSSQENGHQTAFSVSTAISQSSSHPSPSLTQGDFCGSHNDLYRMTSLSVSNIFWFVAGVLFKHKWMKFSRELLLDAHQGTVLLDVSVLVGKKREREKVVGMIEWELWYRTKQTVNQRTFVYLFKGMNFWCFMTNVMK